MMKIERNQLYWTRAGDELNLSYASRLLCSITPVKDGLYRIIWKDGTKSTINHLQKVKNEAIQEALSELNKRRQLMRDAG